MPLFSHPYNWIETIRETSRGEPSHEEACENLYRYLFRKTSGFLRSKYYPADKEVCNSRFEDTFLESFTALWTILNKGTYDKEKASIETYFKKIFFHTFSKKCRKARIEIAELGEDELQNIRIESYESAYDIECLKLQLNKLDDACEQLLDDYLGAGLKAKDIFEKSPYKHIGSLHKAIKNCMKKLGTLYEKNCQHG